MRISLALFLFVLGFSNTAFLEPSKVDPNKNGESHGIGVGGTVYETWGFAYRHHFASRFGITANLGGGFWNNSGHAGLAVGGMYSFAHHTFPNSGLPRSSIRIYLIAYGSGIYGLNSSHKYYREMSVSNYQHTATVGLGAGPAIEYYFTENFSLFFEIPWMTKVTITPSKGLAFLNSYPNFGGGFLYYF